MGRVYERMWMYAWEPRTEQYILYLWHKTRCGFLGWYGGSRDVGAVVLPVARIARSEANCGTCGSYGVVTASRAASFDASCVLGCAESCTSSCALPLVVCSQLCSELQPAFQHLSGSAASFKGSLPSERWLSVSFPGSFASWLCRTLCSENDDNFSSHEKPSRLIVSEYHSLRRTLVD